MSQRGLKKARKSIVKVEEERKKENKESDAAVQFLDKYSGLSSLYKKNLKEQADDDYPRHDRN